MGEEFQINKSYADNYNKWRGKEELQRLKDKYGKDAEFESSDTESDDDISDALDPELEEDWLKTLTAIKNKDPRIYDKEETFYREKTTNNDATKHDEKTTKPIYLKDIERKVILERGGKYEDDSSDEDEKRAGPSHQQPSYFEEQRELQKSLVDAAFKCSDEEEDSDNADCGLFTKKIQSSNDKLQEEKSYEDWKKTQPEPEPTTLPEKQNEDLWNGIGRNDCDQYLRNYIQNKQYMAKSGDEFPSYEQVVAEELSDDEEIVNKQEDFERKYNFRYEDPDPEFIKSYPRTMMNSVRRKDTSRVDKRNELRERKQLEKDKKKAELRQLKNLKKQEIESKLEQLRQLVGDSESFKDVDIDGDFDPAEHDRIMQNVFADEYYDNDDTNAEKPVFNDDEDDIDWDKWDGNKEQLGEEQEVHIENGDVADLGETSTQAMEKDAQQDEEQDDEQEKEQKEDENDQQDFNMDADFDPNIVPRTKPKRGGRKRTRFERAILKKKPVFEPSKKTFEQYFDEYYKLDYEDIIDDMPCRFKYRPVMANDFGLSTDEIINAKDKELNSWVSIKKMSQYRSEDLESEDKETYKRKSYNTKKKANMFPSLQEWEREQPSTSNTYLMKKTKFDDDSLPIETKETKDLKSPLKKKVKSDNVPNKANTNINKKVDKGVKKNIDTDVTKNADTDVLSIDDNLSKTDNIDTDVDMLSKSEVSEDNKVDDNKLNEKSSKIDNENNQGKMKKQKNKKNKNDNKTKKVEDKSKIIKKKKKKNNKKMEIISDERLKSFGINPKKYKYEILKNKHENIKKFKQNNNKQ